MEFKIFVFGIWGSSFIGNHKSEIYGLIWPMTMTHKLPQVGPKYEGSSWSGPYGPTKRNLKRKRL